MAIESDIPGIRWPTVPPRSAATLLAMLYQFDQSQWLSADTIRQAQDRQLLELIRHAATTVPFYGDRIGHLREIRNERELFEAWETIPLLTRSEVQANGDQLTSQHIPKAHGQVHSLVTSGSTGQPLHCKGTQITRFFWQCVTLRDHQWHRRDFSRKLAAIRYTDAASPPDGKQCHDWGVPVNLVAASGPSAVLTTESTVAEQADWLRQQQPAYLIAYPSNIKSLARLFIENAWDLPGLCHVRSFGEILEQETRELCNRAWGVPVVDCYSSQEVGYVALECPDNPESYHVQSETALVEILDENGKVCQPGEVGRVVVTPLHNAAMPLLRYDLGDFAEVAADCPCGRGLPSLKRIVGRQRNMVTLPNGQQRWPGLGRGDVLAKIPPLHQFQIVQTDVDKIEIRLVQPKRFTVEQEHVLAQHICQSLGYPFDYKVCYVDEIKRSRRGKFEEFVSLL